MRKIHRINLDRLEITYKASDEVKERLSAMETGTSVILGGIRLLRTKSRHYNYEYTIYKEVGSEYSRIVGFLYFGSPNPNRCNIYVSYFNEALYDNALVRFRFSIEEALSLEFYQISKLDIAIDWNFNIQRFLMKTYKDFDYDLIINGKKMPNELVEGVGAYSGNNPRKRLLANPELIVCNEGRTLTFKCYDKRREIEQNHKPYISDGFNHNKIYRMEVSCKNHKAIKKSLDIAGLTDEELYECLQDTDVLTKIFMTCLNRLIRLQRKRKSFNFLIVALKDVKDIYLDDLMLY